QPDLFGHADPPEGARAGGAVYFLDPGGFCRVHSDRAKSVAVYDLLDSALSHPGGSGAGPGLPISTQCPPIERNFGALVYRATGPGVSRAERVFARVRGSGPVRYRSSPAQDDGILSRLLRRQFDLPFSQVGPGAPDSRLGRN